MSPMGLSPHDSKIAAIQALSPPANLTELRSKLQFLNYYRCYVPDFATIAAPLNALLKKDVPWVWTDVHDAAFNKWRSIMCEPGVVLRRYDQNRPTVLYTDWSGVGIAAVLAQKDDQGDEYIVACLSRSLNVHERNYSSYEGEMLAAVWGVKAFRQYLHGVKFTLITDHQPLKWLMSTADLTGKHMRWALILQEFEFTVLHRPGTSHGNVDVPSRYPLPESFDPTGACLDPESPASTLAAFPCALSYTPHSTSLAAALSLDPVSPMPDTFLPTAHDLLEGHNGLLSDSQSLPSRSEDSAAATETRCVQQLSAGWVQAVAGRLSLMKCDRLQQLSVDHTAQPDAHGVYPVSQLCTELVGSSFMSAANEQGIVVYDAFGGLCAGLDMVLSNGIKVCKYIYSDIDPAAQQVARQRVAYFHAQYPHLFSFSAAEHAFDALPMDVRDVDSAALVSAGALDGQQWLVVAGWSCEDLSPAGKGKGLAGARSSNFYDIVRILGALQQLQREQPPAYILENTAMQVSFAHPSVRQHDFPLICRMIGQPVLFDAARFGSFAHRLRNFWSNLAHPAHVAAVIDTVDRAPRRFVDSVLDPGHFSKPVQKAQSPPFYPCNVPGQPLSALPTLVACQLRGRFVREVLVCCLLLILM